MIPMATASETPTEYIQHHLTFLTKPVGTGGFWTLNVDTLIMTALLGLVTFGFLYFVSRKATAGVPSKTQAFVEWFLDFVNGQVKSVYNGTTALIAPMALTTFVLTLFMNAMDVLPLDLVAKGLHALGVPYWRVVPTADVNTTFALAFAVLGLSIFYAIKIKGLGGWVRELFCAPFGSNPVLWILNLLFNVIEYVSKTLSHSLRLFGNMYAGEIMFLVVAMLGASGYVGLVAGAGLHVAWSIFELLIILLQAYIFMMLTVVYLAMAHEHH
jgi:F-type H+-transporting ATPase subunit a